VTGNGDRLQEKNGYVKESLLLGVLTILSVHSGRQSRKPVLPWLQEVMGKNAWRKEMKTYSTHRAGEHGD